MDKTLRQLDRMLKALADPTRLRMVSLLQTGAVCVCHIHESLDIPQPKASRHLAYLKRAGIVHSEKRGLWVYYQLAPQSSDAAQRLLDAARQTAAGLATAIRDAKRLAATGCCVEPQMRQVRHAPAEVPLRR